MFKIETEITFDAAHKLDLDYDSPCCNLHGHRWRCVIRCARPELDKNGMVIDFSDIKAITRALDHKDLNTLFEFNTTAENLAKWLCDKIPFCYEVEVYETEKNKATYTKEI